jgi:hypothetical protein
MKRTTVGVAALLVLLAAAAAVEATQVIYKSPQQMGSESSLVVRGTVTGVRSFWNESRTRIYTETIVAVDETYKGTGTPTARVIQPGGVVDNARMHVHGALTWRPGEEVLLFLEPRRRGGHRVSGFSQGKLTIERDPATGEPFITHPALDDVGLLGAPDSGAHQAAPGAAKTPLDRFIQQALGRR